MNIDKIIFATSILLLVVGIAVFGLGIGVFEIREPEVTGLNFLDSRGYDAVRGYSYQQDGNLHISVRGVKGFREDAQGYSWVDLNLRMYDSSSGKEIINMGHILGEGGKSRILAAEGLDPKIKIPLSKIAPGTYIVEVEVIDRYDNDKAIASYSEKATIGGS